MNISWRIWHLGLVSFLVAGGAIASSGNSVLAQIIPDTTLSNENSTVTSTGTVDAIDGGATRGANLFHSFGEFNVSEGRAAVFTNPAGIENILTRVTGANPSNILGTLAVSGGNANLFLINPNGIIFGANARLDVGGSFVGTTASGIGLTNGDTFSANPGEPLPNQLLNVNPNAFFFNQINAGAIANRSIADRKGLEIPQGRSLLLVGGDVKLEGGRLRVPGGHVELGGLAGRGTVGLNADGNNLRLSFPESVARSNLSLSNDADVDVRAGRGGSIAIDTQNLNFTGESSLRAGVVAGSDSIDSQAGNVEVNATGAIALSGESSIANTVPTRAIGKGGDINIRGRSLWVTEGAALNTNTAGRGRGGNLRLSLSDSVQVSGASADGERFSHLTAQAGGLGDAGDLTINTGKFAIENGGQVSTGTLPSSRGNGGTLTINASDEVRVSGASLIKFFGGGRDGRNFSRLTTRTQGAGRAGNLTINTKDFAIENGAQVSSGASGARSTGNGGNLTVNASESVKAIGFVTTPNDPTFSRLTTRTEGAGRAGDLTINTRNFVIENGAQVSAGTSSGTAGTRSTGDGGNLSVNASDSVKVIGGVETASDLVSSRLTTRTEGTGESGDLTITTAKLLIQDGAQVSAGTSGARGTGDGGNLTVNASDVVEVVGFIATPRNEVRSRLTTRTASVGNAGDLRIATENLIVRNKADVSVGSLEIDNENIDRIQRAGESGNLEVEARSILLDDRATLNAQSGAVNGGNVSLQNLDFLLMRRNSQISTTAGSIGTTGNGGNINIDTDLLVAVPLENSNITANAFRGNGGRVNITSQGIFGIQFRENETLQSDITASSRFGLDGVVELDTPDVDPNRGLVSLPVVPVDTQVARTCNPGGSQQQSEFVVTGRGGLPQNPGESLNTDAVQVDLVTLKPQIDRPSTPSVSTNSISSTPTHIVEAQGWAIAANGDVILTANAPTVTPHNSWQTTANCKG